MSFVLKENNLEIGGDAIQTGESSQATSFHGAQIPVHYEASPSAGPSSIPVDCEPSELEIPVHYEPALSTGPAQIGEADADEYEGTVQSDILEEDEDGIAEDLDSDEENSDDEEENEGEDVPIPSYWNQDMSAVTTVHDGQESSWEYHMNNIQIGAQYSTKQQIREAVIQWALSTQRVFRTDVSNKQYLTMSCDDIGCPSRVHAHLPKYGVMWEVTDVVPHTCEIKATLKYHPNLTSTLIARLLFSEIVEKKDMVAKHIVRTVKARWKTNIKYGKAWRAKQRALEDRFGSFYDAYDNVVRLVSTLKERNPGTYACAQMQKFESIPEYGVFGRLFFSFAICIEAFTHCRPVLCVDGTFLTGKYKGQILTAIGVDGNNMIVPIAFAFVESENYESWLWFFRQIKMAVVKTRPNVCVLHDRHAGMLKAIKALQHPAVDEEAPWTDMQSRWCMRHLGANFYSCFKSKRLMNLFKRLCNQNQEKKYQFLWERLTEFTRNQVKERRAAQAQALATQMTDPEPVGLCDLPGIDPAGTKRKKGKRIRNFEEWIEKEPPVKWSLLHDEYGARYGIMTTNLAEVYNFVLRGNRSLPLTALVEGILHGTLTYFRDRRREAVEHIEYYPNTPYSRKIRLYMDKKIKKARLHTVIRIGNEEARYEVRLPTERFGAGNELKTHEVIISDDAPPTCECTCNKPRLLHLPCSHVLAVCAQMGMNPISFVSPYYYKEAVVQTWTGEMTGFRVVGNFNKVNPEERQYIPHPQMMRTSRGRRNSRRIRNDMDESEAGGPTRQCLYCNLFGHREKNCPKYGLGPAPAPEVGNAPRGRGRGNRGARGRGQRG